MWQGMRQVKFYIFTKTWRRYVGIEPTQRVSHTPRTVLKTGEPTRDSSTSDF